MKKQYPSLIQKFIDIEGLSGILLFGATVIAMVWANSPFVNTYEALWGFKIGVNSTSFELTKPLILWVNDGLMAVFFFLIGLEIKRELLIGELNSLRKATFPIFAAIGGMVVPLALYLVFNQNPETVNGWGIPMATDIAFSLAILKALGKYVPLSLKIFLTAFAIVDDLGAVIIIALFYSASIKWTLIIASLVLLGGLSILSFRNSYNKYIYFIVGAIVWVLFLKSGIHPTIAGVLLALTIPIKRKIDTKTFANKLSEIENQISNTKNPDDYLLSKKVIEEVDYIEDLVDDVQSPLQHLEHKLHGWVAYVIMPIFALANAGIQFSSDINFDFAMIGSIAIALFGGKLIGIPLFSYIAVKLNLAELPENTNFLQIIGVAILAGVGFTMSIFIANLAFEGNFALIGSAKVGILLGSAISAVVGSLVLIYAGRNNKAKASV